MYPSRTFVQGARQGRVGKALQTSRADERIRTADPFITSEVLYQLSYVGVPGNASSPSIHRQTASAA